MTDIGLVVEGFKIEIGSSELGEMLEKCAIEHDLRAAKFLSGENVDCDSKQSGQYHTNEAKLLRFQKDHLIAGARYRFDCNDYNINRLLGGGIGLGVSGSLR